MRVMVLIIKDVLKWLYTSFGTALIISVLTMFVYKMSPDLYSCIHQWLKWFKTEKEFRKKIYLVFYVSLMLCRTLLNRDLWLNPITNVIGVWGLYQEIDGAIVFTAEMPENIALFIPFIILVFWNYENKWFDKCHKLWPILKKGALIVFCSSFIIELLQLLLRVGTWQLSDLICNTGGGIIGCMIYWLLRRISVKKGNAN